MNMENHLKAVLASLTLVVMIPAAAIATDDEAQPATSSNPFSTSLNEPIAYGEVTAAHVTEYGDTVLAKATAQAKGIRKVEKPTFDNVIRVFDDIEREISKAADNCFMLYWVSPDEATRDAGLAAYKKLDSWSVDLNSDKAIYRQIQAIEKNTELEGVAAKLVNDLALRMRHSGVELEPDDLARYKVINEELNELTTRYSTNMNRDTSVVVVDEAGAEGLSDTFKSHYAKEGGGFEIPVIAANLEPVLSNAADEDTRRQFATLYANLAAEKNLEILDELVAKRYELARIMGHDSYADYSLEINMAENPENVWVFLNDLTQRTTGKAIADLERLKQFRQKTDGITPETPLNPWDSSYYANSLIKAEYGVDGEKVREYLPLAGALKGMMALYQELLGLEFRQVEKPSVWHEEVEMYGVYLDGKLSGYFYLDLFPRPNKESWFYGVTLTPGGVTPDGREVPVAMLLGNFTQPTDELPSLITHGELDTLFHEFGHIVNSVSYAGDYALQSVSRLDFVEAMSQIFENWIWDYGVVSSFAVHYKTGEVLPEELFESMLEAKNVNSGLSAQRTINFSVYDMMLYHRYNPKNPMSTDDIWGHVADQFVYSSYIEGTHPQANWIHINTHPVYMYGYLWSRVYAQDMFTQFEEHGLRDAATGARYRQIILANGTQKPIEQALEEFLGRSSNNEAYIRSLGLE